MSGSARNHTQYVRAVMRLVIGDRTINEVLTAGRVDIQQDAEKKLQIC